MVNLTLLNPDSQVIRGRIPKQIELTNLEVQVSSASKHVAFVFKWLFLISFGLNLIFSGGLKYMLIMIRSLQMILHLPMIRVANPGNVIMVIAIISPIA